MGTASAWVSRPRLVDRLLNHRCVVLEAGAGFGKSTLAAQYVGALSHSSVVVTLGEEDGDAATLVASLRRALRSLGWSDLRAALDSNEPGDAIETFLDGLAATSAPLSIVIDDAHHLRRGEGAKLLLRLAQQLPVPHRLLIATRQLPAELTALRLEPSGACLDSSDLAFTSEETQSFVHQLSGGVATAETLAWLQETTSGWATALVLAISVWRSGQGLLNGEPLNGDRPPPQPATIAAPIPALLDSLLSRLTTSDRDALTQLAHLPLLSAEIADLTGDVPGVLDRLIDAGVPFARTPAGWWELPGPVVSALRGRKPLDAEIAKAAALVCVRVGEALVGVRLLLASGFTDEAAAVIAEWTPATVDDLGFAALNDLMSQLPESSKARAPRSLLHLARSAEASHRNDIRTAALTAVRDLSADATSGDLVRVRREVSAEIARDLMWDERTRPESWQLAQSVVDEAADGEPIARARALDVLGRLASWFSAVGPRSEAVHLLTESAELSRQCGPAIWVAQALTPLAIGYYYAVCRYADTLRTLDDALAELPARSTYRATIHCFRTDVLTEVGRFDEAEAALAEMREIGQARGEEWMLAYASWSGMVLASYRGDHGRAVSYAGEAEAHRDVWYEQVSGVEFLVQAADSFARLSDGRRALHYLDRARERMAGIEKVVRLYEAAVLCRVGDPCEAESAAVSVLQRPDIEPQERWPLELLRAYAAYRRGDAHAGELAALAFEDVAGLGHREGPLIREPATSRILLPLAADAGSATARAITKDLERLSITALGSFRVERAGQVVDLPAGRPALAVRAVVAAGGRIRIDALDEILWPDADPVTARNRLRNLLSRLNAASGEVLVRASDALQLPAGATVDADSFERDGREVIHGPNDRSRPARARAAMARYRGEFLADDDEEPWLIARRLRLRLLYLELLDLVATEAEQRGETDEAIRLTERGIEVEPQDERRYLQLAAMLLRQGRSGSAKAVVDAARLALAEVGLEPSRELAGLARTLQRA